MVFSEGISGGGRLQIYVSQGWNPWEITANLVPLWAMIFEPLCWLSNRYQVQLTPTFLVPFSHWWMRALELDEELAVALNWMTRPRRKRRWRRSEWRSWLASGRVLNRHQSPILITVRCSTFFTIRLRESTKEASWRTRNNRSLLIFGMLLSRNQQRVDFLTRRSLPSESGKLTNC